MKCAAHASDPALRTADGAINGSWGEYGERVEREEWAVGHMTPHTLRRTFASILAELGVPPRRAMYLLGHTDPTLTMRVYQQVLDMGGAAVETLETVLGCTLGEALATYSGREGLGTQWTPGPEIASQDRGQQDRRDTV